MLKIAKDPRMLAGCVDSEYVTKYTKEDGPHPSGNASLNRISQNSIFCTKVLGSW